MDRCVVLVDAGYLLGGASTLLTGGSSDRNQLRPDYEAMISAVHKLASAETGLPVLRIYWYDAARDRQPTPAHRKLRVLPDVKVRLGNLATRDDGRIEQKGVDAELHADLTTLARHRAVADVVLLTGDEDLRRAVEEAQEYGVRVHLWAVEAGAPAFNQSQELIAAADRRHVLDRGWISAYIDLAESSTSAAEPGPQQQQVASHRPTPMDMPRRPMPTPVTQQPDEPRTDFPRLSEVTTRAQEWRDNEDDVTAVVGEPDEVGYVYGARWCHRVTAEQHAALAPDRPIIPRQIDGDLLRYAERLGVETWENENAKHAVRHGFWRAVDAVEDAGEVGSDRQSP